MTDVPFSDIPHRAALTLSILPPSEAHALAGRWLAAWGADDEESGSRRGEERRTRTGTVYVDCNAVSPETVKGVAELFAGSGVGFVDAGIIGGPPREGYDPTFYASATGEDRGALDAFEALRASGLKITCLEGEGVGVGDASALKMSYAGITKGLTGLLTTMILSAHAASPSTATALLHELHASQPMLLQRATRSIPDMLPKAYRWVGEMREIAAFVGGPMGDVHRGMASVYERVERAVGEEGEDKRVLEKFVEDAKEALKKNSE